MPKANVSTVINILEHVMLSKVNARDWGFIGIRVLGVEGRFQSAMKTMLDGLDLTSIPK